MTAPLEQTTEAGRDDTLAGIRGGALNHKGEVGEIHGATLYDGAMFEIALVVTFALLLDRLLGEPRRFHPLVGFGQLASWVEVALFRGRQQPPPRMCGVLAWSGMLFPVLFLSLLLLYLQGAIALVVEIVVLYLAVGRHSLADHGRSVEQALQSGDLQQARGGVGKMVSRETDRLDEVGVAKAATESVLENGSDALFGALFWYLIAGIPGVLLYRAANTLDAMWGYKSDRFIHFGWWSARVDDVLNWVPARLTALSYGLMGHLSSAMRCWREQAADCESPNAGVVMAAGAGALRIQLGGAANYHGQRVERPALGVGVVADHKAIGRSIALLQRTTLLWVALPWAAVGILEWLH